MKQEYSVPELEIILMDKVNIITESNTDDDVVDPNPDWWT